jgi:AraC-like DNA-binding protein
MNELNAYGNRMAGYLHLESAPAITAKTRRKAQLAITRLRSDHGLPEVSKSIPPEKAFLVSLQLREIPFAQLWLGDRLIAAQPYPKGAVSIVDLEQAPTCFTPHAFDCLQFYVSRAALEEVAYDHGRSRIDTLDWPRGEVDPKLNHLAMSILLAIEDPQNGSRLFLDQMMLALLAYVAEAYGGMRAETKIARGGLAPWQMRRATELLRERLDGDVSLSEVAAHCELSVSHFARSFKQAIGQTPHRWLVHRRVDAAKKMMQHSGLRLSEIALGCGFADQTAFNRTFKKIAGTTPGDWRRSCRG